MSSYYSPRSIDVLKPNPNVISRRLGDDIVLFNLDSDRFYELNGTAARFWELLHQGQDVDEIRKQLLEEFSVDAEQLKGESSALIDSLRQENLITSDE
jgi:hypothetical protein